MALKIGDFAPDFEVNSTEGIIRFHHWLGVDWCLILTHPSVFTPVCKSEIIRMISLCDELKERKVKILAISNNSIQAFRIYFMRLREIEKVQINFPIISDEDKRISKMYGFLNKFSEPASLNRSVYLIDHDRRIRMKLDYPLSTGRNFYEILRIIDSIQLTKTNNMATPADWHFGEKLLRFNYGIDDKNNSGE